LVYELRKRGLEVESQLSLPIGYGEVKLDVGYRIDLLVEKIVIVEIKAWRRFCQFTRRSFSLLAAQQMSFGIAHQLQCLVPQRRYQTHGQ
jgi:GxxExxY protein